jgi:hypothetical protein
LRSDTRRERRAGGPAASEVLRRAEPQHDRSETSSLRSGAGREGGVGRPAASEVQRQPELRRTPSETSSWRSSIGDPAPAQQAQDEDEGGITVLHLQNLDPQSNKTEVGLRQCACDLHDG